MVSFKGNAQLVQSTTLGLLEKTDSSSPKNVLENTNEHTCDYLRYVSFPICLHWSAVWFWGVIRKKKTIVMDSLYACNFIKKWLQYRCFPVKFAKVSRTTILQNICEQMFFWPCEHLWPNKVLAQYERYCTVLLKRVLRKIPVGKIPPLRKIYPLENCHPENCSPPWGALFRGAIFRGSYYQWVVFRGNFLGALVPGGIFSDTIKKTFY